MPTYRCRVADSRGKTRELVFEAKSEDLVLRDLSAQGLFPIEIAATEPDAGHRRSGRTVSKKAVIDFTDSLALMLSSGVSFKDAVRVLAASVLDRGAKSLASSVSESLAKGKPFSEALAPFGRSFSSVYRGLVRIGERIGTLESVIQRLSLYLHEDRKIRDRALNALTYPALVLCVAVLGAGLIAAVVLPGMREMFASLGDAYAERIDRAVGAMTGVMIGLAVTPAAAAAAALTALAVRRKNRPFAMRFEAIMFRLPAVGAYMKKRSIMHFAFAMEILTANGVPVEDSLTEAASGIASELFREEAARLRRAVERGERLSAAFLATGFFPERIGVWTAVGEQTGQVDKVFAQIRMTYQAEIENWSARFMTLIEPAVILVMGAMMLMLVLVFIVPMFSMFGSLL